MANEFWKFARRRLVHWAAVSVDLAGYEVNPLSVLELIDSAPLTLAEATKPDFQRSFLFRCLRQAQRRIDSGNLAASATDTFHRCSRFWLHEYPDMAETTRSCLLFEVRSRFEAAAYGDAYGHLLERALPIADRHHDDWDFL